MDVQPPTSSSHPQATDSKPVEKFDAASFATRMSSFDQTCSCCPYGYHIDLDFLRYLDSLYSSDTLKRLKRIRCSKDGSLPRSVETPPPPPPPPPQHAPQVNRTSPTYTIVSENLVTCAATRRGGKEVIVELDISPSNERSTVQSSTESTVVSPNSDSKFRTETELFISNSSGGDSSEHLEPSIRLTEERRVHTSRSVVQTESSYSKRTLERPVHLTLTQPDESIPTSPYRPFSRGSSSSPVDSDASSSISPAVLQAIREQMALSLRRMKELEEQVKVIPALQARILTLVRENQHLAEAVRSSEGIPVRASEVPIRASGSRSLVDAWTQTLESFQSRADFWNTTGGRREVDVNFNRVLEETVAGVAETDEVSTTTEQNGTKSVEGKYYSVAIQCQLPTGGACFKEEMTSVAVDVRPSVISRCVGTDDGFLWHPADNGPSDISTQSSRAATYEQRLAWWLKLGVDKATSVDDNLASDPDVRVEFLEERQHARSHAVQSMTVDRVQLAAPWTPTGESLGEAVLNEDNIAVQRNVDFEKRLYEDSVEEEVLSFSDRSFEFEAAIAKAETSLLQSGDINRLSSVKSDGADSVDEDVVLVEKAVGGCDKLRLEREMALLEESDVGWKRENLFATTEGVCLEKESDRSGRRDSFGLEMSRVVTAGEISDTVKEGETNDEGISDTGEEVQAKDEETSNAGEEAEKKEEEIPEAAGKPGNTRGGEGSIDSRAAVNDKDEEVLGEHEEAEIKPENEDKPIGEAVGSEDRSTKTEFILIGDQIVRSPVLESKRGTMSLETNLEVLLEQDVEKEEEQDVSVEMSLVNEKQEQVCEGNPVLIVDSTNSDVISVVMSAQRTVTASEETALSRLEAGSEEVSETRNEAEYEDEGISDTGEDAEAKNEDISDVGKVDKERVNDNEEITAAGEETRSKDTEIVDLHAAVANKDGHVLGEDQEAEDKAKEAESENNKDETKCEDKELLDERESKEVLRRGRFLNEDTLDTFTDSEKEGGEDILDTDSDMTRTDEESGGSYEIDVRVADEDIVFTIETGQVNNSTSTSKRNQLEVLVETHEETVAREGDSEVENTSKLIGEAVVAMDTIGVTMKTEVTHTSKVTDNSEIDELEWERSPVDAVVESAGVGENVLKSIEVEVVADTDVQCVHVEVGSEVVGTSRSLVAGEERVVINKVSEQNESDIKVLEVKVSEEKVSEQNESEVKVPGVNVSEEKVSEQNEFEVKVSEQNESAVKVSEQNESGIKVSEQNESGVKVPEVKVSKENESKENESEVKVSKVQVSEVKVSEEKIYEEKVSEENESDVKVPEVKASEVKVSQEKVSEQNESEVKVPGINVSEKKVFEQNESQVTVHKVKVSKEKVSKENESEEMVSEVRVSEEGVSEVKVSEAKKSEAKVPEEMESEAKVLQEKESGVRGSKEMESEKREYEVKVLGEKISDVRVSKKIVSEEIDSKATEYEEMESKVKVSGQMESEVKASEEMESEVRVSKEKESEISEPQEKESEVEVAEEKESEVELAEEKKSEVEVAGEKESEVQAAEEKESEVEAAEEKKSEVEVAEEKKSEIEVAEEKESEVEVAEEKESEVVVAEEKESEVEEAEEKKSEVEVAEEKKSEVEAAEEKKSEVEVAEEKEAEVEEAEEKESEISEPQENESEVEVAEEKESEVELAEEKKSEVEVAGEKKSEIEVAEEKESEVEVAEEKESEVEVAEEKEFEVEEAEEKESEVEVAEEKESEVMVAEEMESEVEAAEEKESEVVLAEEKKSEVEAAEDMASDGWELVEQLSDAKALSTEESYMMESDEKETITKQIETKESEEWEMVDKESDRTQTSGELSELVESSEAGSKKVIELSHTTDTPHHTIMPSIDHVETISALDGCNNRHHESIIVSKAELCQLANTEHELENSSAGDTLDQRSGEPEAGLLDAGGELVRGFPLDEEVTESLVLCENVEQTSLELGTDNMQLVSRKTKRNETAQSIEPDENIVLDTSVEPDENIELDSSLEPDENIELDTSVEPDNNIVLDTRVEPEKSTMPKTGMEPTKVIVSHINMEPDESAVCGTCVEPGYHAMPSESMGPLETKRAETAEMFIETSPTETSYISSEHQSIDFCSTESTSTKRVIITETRIERRRADHHVSSQGSSQKSRGVGSDELQNDGPPPEEEDEYAMVGMKSDSFIPSSSDSQSADDSQRTADSIVVRPDVLAACAVYAEYLRDPTVAVDSDNVVSCVDFLRNHWFDLSGRKTSDASLVQFHLDEYLTFGTSLAQALINMADSDGNTAMHYSVSYGNMDVIEVLLNTGLCNVDKQNKAGYTSIMLASLLLVDLDQHEPLVFRLFHSGDVNSTSATSGQTSLMLASSHGRSEMVSLLLESGAEINLQDEDGSTALMCATEHGHNEVIRTLLNHPLCDSTISDVDGSTALSIAMEEGHHDIGVFLYAHMKAIDDRLLEDD